VEVAGREGLPLASVVSAPGPGRVLTRRMDGKARPRDRQLIQEKLQALRDLLTGTSKVSCPYCSPCYPQAGPSL